MRRHCESQLFKVLHERYVTQSSSSRPSEGVFSSSSNEARLGDDGGSGIMDEVLHCSCFEEPWSLSLKNGGYVSTFASDFSILFFFSWSLLCFGSPVSLFSDFSKLSSAVSTFFLSKLSPAAISKKVKCYTLTKALITGPSLQKYFKLPIGGLMNSTLHIRLRGQRVWAKPSSLQCVLEHDVFLLFKQANIASPGQQNCGGREGEWVQLVIDINAII